MDVTAEDPFRFHSSKSDRVRDGGKDGLYITANAHFMIKETGGISEIVTNKCRSGSSCSQRAKRTDEADVDMQGSSKAGLEAMGGSLPDRIPTKLVDLASRSTTLIDFHMMKPSHVEDSYDYTACTMVSRLSGMKTPPATNHGEHRINGRMRRGSAGLDNARTCRLGACRRLPRRQKLDGEG